MLVAAYHFVARGRCKIDQTEALLDRDPHGRIRGRPLQRPAGLARLRARPVWRILLYSADEPPTIRGLVQIDAVDGTVMGEYTEPNPEDWSQLAHSVGITAGLSYSSSCLQRPRMELDAGERDLLLAALFHLRIDHAEDDAKGAQIEALVVKSTIQRRCSSAGTGLLGATPVRDSLLDDAPTRDD